jgi:16S rRNA (adenine1518-N6/adenine1519-N6)-dimethyltransferase
MPQTLAQIRDLLQAHGLSPRKALGQNFLIDANLIRKLITAAAINPADLILEVGPGTGALTDELLAQHCRVIACELDRGLDSMLRTRLTAAFPSTFTLIEGDCLHSKREVSRDVLAALAARPFKLVANLPYGAATPLMLALLVHHPECSGMYVTIQREVADRLTAAPGSHDFGPLAVIAQTIADVSLIATLPPECFWPRPDVTSAMVAITRKPQTLAPAAARRLADFAQKLFNQRRKQIGSTLGRTFPFPPDINPSARAEDLTIPQIRALADLAPPDAPASNP